MTVITPFYKAYSLSREEFKYKLRNYYGRMLRNYAFITSNQDSK